MEITPLTPVTAFPLENLAKEMYALPARSVVEFNTPTGPIPFVRLASGEWSGPTGPALSTQDVVITFGTQFSRIVTWGQA